MFMTLPIDPLGSTLAWGINTESPERTREEWAELERSGEAARQAKSNYDGITTEPVRSLLDGADITQARVWAPYYIPDIPTWHTSRVCLIGDAAHGLPPNGLGSGLAFEDAAILTRLIVGAATTGTMATNYNDLFSRLEAIRRPRIEGIRKTTKTGETFKSKTGPWMWWAKQWGMRGYFWWNNGILEHAKETGYDVDKVEIQDGVV
jgi:2-polyprenyl-6-methoxyphenol hydroxylase-like FAD-dependent oxidoreductase